jgi:hypothetical protein
MRPFSVKKRPAGFTKAERLFNLRDDDLWSANDQIGNKVLHPKTKSIAIKAMPF